MGLFDGALGLLTGQSSMTEGQVPTSATAGPTSVQARLEGKTQSISFGGEGTNWIIIVGVIAAIFLLTKK